jgi:uncharacterized protein
MPSVRRPAIGARPSYTSLDLVVANVNPAGSSPAPLVLNTHELARRPGASRRFHATVSAPEDLGTDVVAVPEGAPLELDLLLESVLEGVLVTGTVRAQARGACVRCLDDVVLDLEVPVQELFVYPERAEAASESGDRDIEERELDGDMADLTDAVRDAIVLELPFQPLCREDCQGLCPQCGVRLEDDPGHAHELADPRWAKLEGLFDQGD